MTTAIRWFVVALLTGHGLIHVLGAAKGFGWADVPQLTESIGVGAGVLWLLGAALVLAAAMTIARRAPTWWWVIALGAAAASQTAIATSWSDARVGTVANLVLVLAAGYGLASQGLWSFHVRYQERATRALNDLDAPPAMVSEADLTDLPGPLAAYVRKSGAVGRPRVVSFRADFHGRIRSGPSAAWMPFTGHQVNTYGPDPQRIFLMDATRSGLPVTVLHEFVDTTATMRVKLLSLATVVNAAGAEMDLGETVTIFNDLVVMAPGAIAAAPATWTTVDAHHVRGDFTSGDQTVSAVLSFNQDHDLVDFVSDDRTRASAGGTSYTHQRWSTPLSGHRDTDGRRVLTTGKGVWHAPQPEGTFTYLEYHLDDIAYNVSAGDATTHPLAAPAGIAVVSEGTRR